MDYHAGRFADASVIFRCAGRLAAVMPGNIEGDMFNSHAGLTYGGLVTDSRATAEAVVAMMRMLAEDLRARGVRRLIYVYVAVYLSPYA